MKRDYGDERIVTKAARLAVLWELNREGLLKGHTLQVIADAFGAGLHRSTILRDLRSLKRVRRMYQRVSKRLDRDRLRHAE